MIVVAAMVKVKEGKGDEVEQAFKKLVPQVRKDPGVIAYIINRSIDDPTKFFVYEKYEDRDALKYHGATPHFKEFGKTMADLREKPSEVGLFNEII
ncbi:MAG: putative quinol monooxygenase [Dehalococcoidales bacterium]|nr:putative quinol monooxygenase [Dehalococcoidales bacterium]